MFKLDETFKQIGKYPNGTQVALRLGELLEMGIQNEALSKNISQILTMLEFSTQIDEGVLGRKRSDIFNSGNMTQKWLLAMKDSTDEEWHNFALEHSIAYDRDIEFMDKIRVCSDNVGMDEIKKFLRSSPEGGKSPELK